MAFTELTNLLPPTRKKRIRSIYLIRLTTVCIAMITFIVLSSAALLVPSYIYLHQQNSLRETELEKLNTTLTLSGGKDVANRFASISQDTAYLARLATTSSATSVVTALTAVPHPGISISGMSYTPASKGVPGKMIVNGSATTRSALHAYIDTLNNQTFITNADLPISAYAKEKDIQFSVTVTGTLTP